MGKQKEMYRQGKDGNILYYNWKNIACVRTIPGKVYQSPAVIAQKKANGLSTTLGGILRRSFAGLLPFPKSMEMQTALRLSLLKWLKTGPLPARPPATIPFLSGFSFNSAASLQKCMKLLPAVTLNPEDQLCLSLPELVPTHAFAAPAQTESIVLNIAAASCGFTTGTGIDMFTCSLSIDYNDSIVAGQVIPLPLSSPAHSLTLVALALEYYATNGKEKTLITNGHFLPASIIGGMVKTGA